MGYTMEQDMTEPTFADPGGVMVRLADRLCECGCGGSPPIAKRTRRAMDHVKGYPVRFIPGHSGAANGNKIWYLDKKSGRWVIAGRNGINYLWYRVLMENEIGHPLTRYEYCPSHRRRPRGRQVRKPCRYVTLGPCSTARCPERVITSDCRKGHRWTSAEARVIGKLSATITNARRGAA